MELAARLGGGHDAELARRAGVDLNGLAIVSRWATELGRSANETLCRRSRRLRRLPRRRPRAPARGGGASKRPRRFQGCWVRVYRTPGRRFGPLRRGADRAGAVLAVGDDRDDALPSAPCRRREYALSSMRTGVAKLGFQPPAIGEEEVEAVAETLRSGWLTTGPRAALLEQRMAAYLEAEHVVALASGTAAMHLALVALGVGPGDEVVTTPITWPATANVIEHCGARPSSATCARTISTSTPRSSRARSPSGRRRSCPSTWPGSPADLDPLWALGVPVVEDAAHAVESRYRGRKLGGISEATCFSLYATKNVAAGEGGLVATNDEDSRTRSGDAADPPWRRLALRPRARVQGEPLGRARGDRARPARQDRATAARARQFELYDEGLAGLDGIAPLARDARDTHAHHLYVVRIDPERAGADRDDCGARSPRRGSRPRSTSCPCTG